MDIKTADKLQKLRKDNGFSQDALAEQLGISRQSISKWERGESSPDTDNLVALAKIYGVTVDELIDSDKEIHTKNRKKKKESPAEKKPRIYKELSTALFKFPFPFIILILYLIMSYFTKLWHPMWLLFLFIPIYYHLAGACCTRSKKGFLFALPIPEIIIFLYLILGFLKGTWGIGAILFLAIPVYYWAVAFYKNKE